MITATEALQMPAAKISEQDHTEARAMIEVLDGHVRKYMTFGGPTPLEVPYRAMSKTASQVVSVVMKRFKWNVMFNLMAEQARFQGAAPTPHHWVIQMVPMIDIYDALLADFDIEPRPLLM